MTIDELLDIFRMGFSFLNSTKILGMPMLFWFILVAIFGIMGGFIKGVKKDD